MYLPYFAVQIYGNNFIFMKAKNLVPQCPHKRCRLVCLHILYWSLLEYYRTLRLKSYDNFQARIQDFTGGGSKIQNGNSGPLEPKNMPNIFRLGTLALCIYIYFCQGGPWTPRTTPLDPPMINTSVKLINTISVC